MRSQKGFTIIELLIALAITSAIGGGISMAVIQIFDHNAQSTTRMIAVKQVENTVHWLNRDVQMAQVVAPTANPDPDGLPLTLSWVEWDNTENEVVYALASGELTRSYSIDGGEPNVRVVARYANPDSALTNCSLDGAVLTFKITATVSEGSKSASESRTVDILARSAP